MNRPLWILGSVLALAAFPSRLAPASVQKLKNEKVSVNEDTLAPGEAPAHPSYFSQRLPVLS